MKVNLPHGCSLIATTKTVRDLMQDEMEYDDVLDAKGEEKQLWHTSTFAADVARLNPRRVWDRIDPLNNKKWGKRK